MVTAFGTRIKTNRLKPIYKFLYPRMRVVVERLRNWGICLRQAECHMTFRDKSHNKWNIDARGTFQPYHGDVRGRGSSQDHQRDGTKRKCVLEMKWSKNRVDRALRQGMKKMRMLQKARDIGYFMPSRRDCKARYLGIVAVSKGSVVVKLWHRAPGEAYL